jgi:hypothetical protein
MPWVPITREQLLELMSDALGSADDTVKDAWERIRIVPEKWQCSPWGDDGGGFWAVAVKPDEVVWYNDIEEGFNTSPFTTRGVIGEYRCNQTEFGQFLVTLPEAIVAERFAALEASAAVPPELSGAGRIRRRQTTYWDLETNEGSLVRVHFTHKQEARFSGCEYERVELRREHPLLEQYRQAWASVFVTGAKGVGDSVEAELAGRVFRATAGWRGAGEYLDRGGSGALSVGFGLLMRAPEPIALIAAEVVGGLGAQASIVPEHRAKLDPRRCEALLLGRSFVIADSFRVVRR